MKCFTIPKIKGKNCDKHSNHQYTITFSKFKSTMLNVKVFTSSHVDHQ